MSHINRSFIIFIILCAGLSACATATPISTTTPFPTETFTPTAKPPTETPTASQTPEPTATEMTAEQWQALSPEERLELFPESLNDTSVSRRLVGDGSLGIAAYFDKDGHITEGYDIFAKKEIPLNDLYKSMMENAGLNRYNSWTGVFTLPTKEGRNTHLFYALLVEDVETRVQYSDEAFAIGKKMIFFDKNDDRIHEIIFTYAAYTISGKKLIDKEKDYPGLIGIAATDRPVWGEIFETNFRAEYYYDAPYVSKDIFDYSLTLTDGVNPILEMEAGKSIEWPDNFVVYGINCSHIKLEDIQP